MLPTFKNKIDLFLTAPSNKPKIIVIYGPTACGKTGLSVEVAKYIEELEVRSWKLEEESRTSNLQLRPSNYSPFIISVDARQVYRHMNIGTGKVTTEEMQWIPHHMLDVINPSEPFSVVDFRERVEHLEVWKNFLGTEEKSEMGVRGKSPLIKGDVTRWQGDLASGKIPPTPFLKGESKSIPIICGGTGLYIDSLIFERSYPSIEADWKLRDELERFREREWNDALWEKLHAIDPEYAKILHPNDRHYIIRGIEVFEKTWQSKAKIIDAPKLKYETLFLTPFDGDRATLYERINNRVRGMFNTWLIEEVWYIMNTFTSTCPGLKTIGYKEVVDYLEWTLSLEESINLVQQHSRNYAKRQITWNKKYDNLNYWFRCI
jgi:tRNA dimethylallyltransferase